MVRTKNDRATAEGAGLQTYRNFVGFSTKEMYKMFGLLCANAVSPKPQFPFWSRIEARVASLAMTSSPMPWTSM